MNEHHSHIKLIDTFTHNSSLLLLVHTILNNFDRSTSNIMDMNVIISIYVCIYTSYDTPYTIFITYTYHVSTKHQTRKDKFFPFPFLFFIFSFVFDRQSRTAQTTDRIRPSESTFSFPAGLLFAAA